MMETDLSGIWLAILQKWVLGSDRILEFLTCIAHPTSIKEYLNDESLQAYLDIKYHSRTNILVNFLDIDHVQRFFFIIMRHAKNDEILEYILENLEQVKPR